MITTKLRPVPVRLDSIRLLLLALGILVAAGGGLSRPALLALGSPCGPAINPIQCENQLPGSPQSQWDVAGAGDPSIQGFATDISIDKSASLPANRTVWFKINTDSANYGIDIYRLGYYAGLGARKVASIQPTAPLPQVQPACLTEAATGLIDCGTWATSASWLIPADAVSGIYIAKLTRFDGTGGSSHIIFVVRDDARPANVLFQTSDTTWQAYNDYGGNSLYVGQANAPGVNPPVYAAARRAYKVSYNRPIVTRGANPQSFVFNAEYPMLRWLEANGYDVKYWTGVDTDRRGTDLSGGLKPNVFLSVGHDEYWSAAQRTNVEAARGAGVNLAFFSGNEMFWKTRMESSIDGSATPNRTLVSYKETFANAKIDANPDWTGTWRDPRFSPPSDGGRPENALTGTIWTVDCCSYAITVPASMGQARFWRNTRVATLAPGTVATLAAETLGYEWDENLDNGSRPTGLAQLSFTDVGSVDDKLFDYGSTYGPGAATHSLTLYRHASGALVFGAGTVQWSWGLDAVHDRGGSHIPEPAMQQATVNLLADMNAQPATLQSGLQPAAASADALAPASTIVSPTNGSAVGVGTSVTVSGTATDSGGGSVAAVEISADGGATWHAATGGATWSYRWTPDTPGLAGLRSRAIDDSGNVESGGAGVTVTVSGGNCPCSTLWTPAAVPAVGDSGDGNPVELGVKFRSDVATSITALRFYKGPNNTGTHVANLWTAAGVKLASATFGAETPSGWQEVSFAAPVSIAAGTTYVASYHTNVGHYAFSSGYFDAAGVDSPPLHALSNASSNGNGVFVYGTSAFPTGTFGAANYWVDIVIAQGQADTTPPQIAGVSATLLDSATTLVNWSTDENATSQADYSVDPTFPPGQTLRVSDAGFDTQHSLTLTALKPNQTYAYRVTSVDPNGNSASSDGVFTTLGATMRDNTSADFGAGTGTGIYISETGDGELILAPTVGSEFSGSSLPTGWDSVPWGAGGYSVIGGGVLLVDGALVSSCTPLLNACLDAPTFLPGHALEFMATFTGDGYQHSGFGVDFSAAPWAMFSTKTGGQLWARTSSGLSSQETNLGNSFLGAPHRFRIEWSATAVNYAVDGVRVASHPIVLVGPMRPIAASDYNVFGGNVAIDWMRMDPFAPSGSFVSRVFDAETPVDWHTIAWTGSAIGPNFAIALRMGNSPTPDATWSGFTPVTPGAISGNSRYIQYRVDLATTDPSSTPELDDITISQDSAPTAVNDTAATAVNTVYTFPASGPGSLVFNDLDPDIHDQLRVVGVSSASNGYATLYVDGSVDYQPAAGFTGVDSFIYTMSDGLFSSTATVTITVGAVNRPPVAANDAYTVAQGAVLTASAASGVLANDSDPDGQAITAMLVTGPAHGTLTLGADGSFAYTPAAAFLGADSFAYRAADSLNNLSGVATATITVIAVNHAPSFTNGGNRTVLEDAAAQTVAGWATSISAGPASESGQALNFIVSNSNNGLFSAQPAVSTAGILTFAPAPNANGSATVMVQLHDNGGTANGGVDTSTAQTFTIAVTAVNDVPSFVKGANQAVSSTAGAQSVVGWATGLSAGPPDEAGQTLNFIVSNSNNGLFSVQPAVSAIGTLTYTPAPTASGSATVTVQVHDNGGTANGGADTSLAQTFTITTQAAPNHAPSFVKGLNQTVLEDSGPRMLAGWATAIDVGGASDAGQTLNFIVGNTNAALFSTAPAIAVDGTLTFTPAPNANGSATVTVQLHDNGGTANGGADTSVAQTFTITVTAVNDAPTFVKGANQSVSSTAGAQSIVGWATTLSAGPSDEAGQALNFIVSNSNNGLFTVQPAVSAIGTLTYSPTPNANGSATVTVQLHDNGGTANGGADTSLAQTFTITLATPNHAPTFTKGGNQTVLEGAAAQAVSGWATAIDAGGVSDAGQTLNFIVSNTNNALFSQQPSVSVAGVLTYTPAPNANGSATVTVQLHDNGGTANGGADTSVAQTFTITVTAVNDVPSFVKGANQTAASSGGTQTVSAWATAISAGPADEAGQLLNFIVTNSNTALFSAQPVVSAVGTLSYTPAANASGTVTVTVQLHDNGGTANGGVDTSAAQTFTITVSGRDTTPPVLTLPANITKEATGPSGAVVSYNVSALDAVDGPSLVLCWPLPGMTFPIGTTKVTCLTSDRSFNLAVGSFNVTVTDKTTPAIASVKPSVTLLSPPDHRMVPITVAVTASDLVDPNPVCTIASVTSSEAISGTGSGDLAPDWSITGKLTVSLRAERASSGSGRTYTLSVRCTDASGNAAIKTATVAVPR